MKNAILKLVLLIFLTPLSNIWASDCTQQSNPAFFSRLQFNNTVKGLLTIPALPLEHEVSIRVRNIIGTEFHLLEKTDKGWRADFSQLPKGLYLLSIEYQSYVYIYQILNN